MRTREHDLDDGSLKYFWLELKEVCISPTFHVNVEIFPRHLELCGPYQSLNIVKMINMVINQ
jgi:hypothetical protein